MDDEQRVRVLPPDGRVPPAGPATPGMHRLEALAEDGVWLGTVVTEPGALTGWHHHGDHVSYIYVIRGHARLDTYRDGQMERQEAGEGSFIVVPRHTVHREGSAGTAGVQMTLVRVGTGPLVVNVDGLPDDD